LLTFGANVFTVGDLNKFTVNTGIITTADGQRNTIIMHSNLNPSNGQFAFAPFSYETHAEVTDLSNSSTLSNYLMLEIRVYN